MKHEAVKKGRRPTNQRAFERIEAAGQKEIIISRKEWKLATPPGKYLLRQRLGREYLVRTLANGKGWVIMTI